MESENDSSVLNIQNVGATLLLVRREEAGFVGQDGEKEGAE